MNATVTEGRKFFSAKNSDTVNTDKADFNKKMQAEM